MTENNIEQRILNYVTGLLYFYGAMDFEGLYRVVTGNLPVNLSLQAFKHILDKEMSDEDSPYDIDHENGLYHHFDVEDPEYVLEEQAKRAEIPFRPVTEKEAGLVVNNQYRALWLPAIKKLDRHLQSRFELSPEDALNKVLDCQDMYRNDASHVEVIDTFIEGLHFNTHEEAQSVINLVMDMVNNTPLWVLKGWTPGESFERFEKQHLKPLPEKPFVMSEQDKQEQLSLFKVGRNEPCPCGSGKKFKKCCDANVPEESSEQPVPQTIKRSPSREEPAREEWHVLYKAAAIFKEAGCWDWMDNEDTFGVMDPETGEIAYCCIMGCTGAHYGLGVYTGAEGLNSLLELMSDDYDLLADQLTSQKCLMASFGDREELTDEDRSVIKELGLSFRGRGNWPYFRSHEPGLFPWFISAWECRFLAHALMQAVEVSLRCRRDKTILESKHPDMYLVRVPDTKNDRITWKDECLMAPPLTKRYASFTISDELLVKRLLSTVDKTGETWEIDTFCMPVPLKEKGDERPYFPTAFLIVDGSSGLILNVRMVVNLFEGGTECLNLLLGQLQDRLPARLLVEREETFYLLQKAAKQLNIDLKRVKRLKMIPVVREKMINDFVNRSR